MAHDLALIVSGLLVGGYVIHLAWRQHHRLVVHGLIREALFANRHPLPEDELKSRLKQEMHRWEDR